MGKIERIQVSPEDRERLERLARDRNTPQKIVWRSKIVLLAGEGIGAVEGGARRAPLRGQGGGRLVEGRPPSARAKAADDEKNQASRRADAQREAPGRHPLERTHDGGAGRHRAVVGAQDLGCARAKAASDENLQALARSELRRQGRGYRRPLPQSARQGSGAGGR